MEPRAGSFGRNVVFDAIVDATQDNETVERVAKSVQPFVAQSLGDGRDKKSALANFLHGTWLGHPLHAVLTDLPIGAWMCAALLDTAAFITKRDELLPGADFCVNAGLAGAVATALTGLAEWSQTYGRPARIGVVHATFNIIATTCYASAALTRKRNRTMGTLYSFAGFGAVMIGGGLGGHLVFAERIGVNHADTEGLPDDFKPVMPESELRENAPRTVQLEGHEVMLVRRGNTIHALLNACAHLGGPLCEGTFDDETVRCPWHGSRYRLSDGLLIDGPATINQPAFEVRLRDGNIELRTASPSGS